MQYWLSYFTNKNILVMATETTMTKLEVYKQIVTIVLRTQWNFLESLMYNITFAYKGIITLQNKDTHNKELSVRT